MHSGRLRRDLQVHCRAGQCPAPEAPGVLPVLRRSVHLGRIRLLRRGPGGVTPITDTLSPRVLLRCSGCGLRWTAATLDPRLSRVRPAGEDRPGAAVRSRPHVTPPRPVSRPRRIAPQSGTPTPDHERPPWHVTGVTPAGQCTRDTRIPRSDQAWQISAISGHEWDA